MNKQKLPEYAKDLCRSGTNRRYNPFATLLWPEPFRLEAR